jgi:hypothetical protein
MAPNLERFAVALPSRSSTANDNIGGTAFGTIPPFKRFPRPKAGKRGPYAPTKRPAPATAKYPRFDEWVSYYVNLIGSKLERLNALQFNLTKDNADKQATLMSKELGSLADALNVGSRPRKTKAVTAVPNPKELRWPLAGSYILQQDPSITGWSIFEIAVYFENEPASRLILNSLIVVTAKDPGTPQSPSSSDSPSPDGDGGGGAPQSSSSSYIQTSSH